MSKVYFSAHPRSRLAIALLAVGFLPPYALAAEWSAEPSVSLRQEFNDNINLTALAHKAVWGTILSPSVTFSGKSEVLEVRGAAQFSFNRYLGAKGLDSDDRIFALESRYKTERDTWGLNASSRRDSTHASEQASTGNILPRAQRNALVIAPFWSHFLTERISFRLEYTQNNVTYDEGASVGLYDNKYSRAQVSLNYLWTDTDTLRISGTHSKSKSIGSSESKTEEIKVGGTHTFSESMQMEAQVGMRKTTSTYFTDVYSCEGTGGSPFKSGSSYLCVESIGGFLFPIGVAQLVDPRTSTRGTSLKLGLLKKFGEVDLLTANLTRDISPSGRGLLLETDHLSIAYSKRFSDKLTGSINTDFYRNRYQAIANSGSQYVAIAPSLSWQLSEWCTLDSGVQHIRQKYESAAKGVSSNLIYGSIRYNWPKMTVSR